MARPNTISTSKLFEETHVDIEGDKFLLRQATRTVEEKHRELIRVLEDKEAEDVGDGPDADAEIVASLLDMYGDLLDIWLEPLGDSKVHAKTLVKKAYKEDKIGLAHLRVLSQQIAEAGSNRPT
jgi:hypothetical protein